MALQSAALTTDASGNSYRGEWLQITLPNAIRLESFELVSEVVEVQSPNSFVVLASADGGTTFTKVLIEHGPINLFTNKQTFYPSSASSFSTFRLVVTSNQGGDSLAGVCEIGDWLLYASPASELTYPPVKLTSSNTTVSGQTYGNGLYIIDASSAYSSTNYQPYATFDDEFQNANMWISDNDVYDTLDGSYAGAFTTNIDGQNYLGEWLQITLPKAIRLREYKISRRQDYHNLSPKDFIIAGSNDNGASWSEVIRAVSQTEWPGNNQFNSYTSSDPREFSTYRLVVMAINDFHRYRTYDALVISEVELVEDVGMIQEKSFIIDSPRAYDAYRVNVTKTPSITTILPPGPMSADTTTIDGASYTASASSSAANSFDWPVWAAFDKRAVHESQYGWATDGAQPRRQRESVRMDLAQ